MNTTAILILKSIADFARPLGAQNPQSVAVQARLRRACTATDLHHGIAVNTIHPTQLFTSHTKIQ